MQERVLAQRQYGRHQKFKMSHNSVELGKNNKYFVKEMLLFSSSGTEQCCIAINSMGPAVQYLERLFLFGGSHKTK